MALAAKRTSQAFDIVSHPLHRAFKMMSTSKLGSTTSNESRVYLEPVSDYSAALLVENRSAEAALP